MIENISTSQAGNILGQSLTGNTDPARVRRQHDSEVDLQVDFGELIQQAKEATGASTEAVEEARRLLASGQLTTAENIREAARKILESGI